MPYATLAQARVEIKASNTNDDPYITQALEFVSERMDVETEMTFAPYIDTRKFDSFGHHIEDLYGRLYLNYPLLAVTTLIDGAGNELMMDDDYQLEPTNNTPHWSILRKPYGVDWSQNSGDWRNAISIAGIWGYRTRYSTEGWKSSMDTVQNNPLAAGGTSITVTDADGVDINARTPRFSPGQLLQIGSEFIEVGAVNTTSNVLTVRRGVRGSTAAAHIQGSAIQTWFPEPIIVRAALRWADYLYVRRGAFSTITVDGFGDKTNFPTDVPEEVQNILDSFRSPEPFGTP